MGFVFTWAGFLGVVASLAALTLAGVVFWTRPTRSQNRRLALMLAVEGLALLGGTGMMYLTDDAAAAWAWQAIAVFFILATPFAYLLFLATLATPLARPLRHPLVEKGLVAGLLLAPLLWFRFSGAIIQGVEPGVYSPWDTVAGPGFLSTLVGVVSISIVGLVLAISAWRRTEPGTIRRSQARSYALAFGVRDVGLPLTVVLLLLAAAGLGGTGLRFAAAVVLPAAVVLAFVLLLAYGILRTQLFDIDLKLKWTLEKSTVAGVFVAVFFIVSEGAQVLFADAASNELIGVLAAGALVFAIAPLQRAAQHVADAAMPGVEDTPEYRRGRKEAIYRAQLEELMADDQVSAKERRALLRLQEDLGLDGDTANRLEREMLEAGGHDG